jgi:DNA-binding SARP family transcriptional activator
MKFGVLGPVHCWLEDRELELGSPQQRGVLAMLLLARGRQVPLGVLIYGLWVQDAPRSAAATVRTYISRLRRLLVDGGAAQAGCLIRSTGDGYALQLGLAVLDLDLFEDGLSAARAARQRQDNARAAALLRSALGLWRGAALAGIPGPYAESRRIPLSELQLAADEERLALEIAAGEHRAPVAELRVLLADHPFRDGLSVSLMLALYRAGRQAEALTVYDTMQRRLREELGVDPGSALQEMYQRILRADSQLMATAQEHAVPRGNIRPQALLGLPGPVQDARRVARVAGSEAEAGQRIEFARHVACRARQGERAAGIIYRGRLLATVQPDHRPAHEGPDELMGRLCAIVRPDDRREAAGRARPIRGVRQHVPEPELRLGPALIGRGGPGEGGPQPLGGLGQPAAPAQPRGQRGGQPHGLRRVMATSYKPRTPPRTHCHPVPPRPRRPRRPGPPRPRPTQPAPLCLLME